MLLIATTIIGDIVEKIKQSDAYGLLTDEVTDTYLISLSVGNIC